MVAALLATTAWADFSALARLFGPDLVNLSPDPRFGVDALVIARALLAAGQADRVPAWLAGLPEGAPRPALGPVELALRASGTPLRTSPTEAFRRLSSRDAGAQRDVLILIAAGGAVDADARAALLTATPAPAATGANAPRALSPGLLAAMEEAASRGAQGETALLAVAALQDGPLARAEGAGLAAVLVALRRVGLDSAAREIAVEALLAR
jgi:hypothetical protein